MADRRRSSWIAALAALLVFVVALAGCAAGDGDGDAPPGNGPPPGDGGHGLEAVDSLPDLTKWPFSVRDIDLADFADPLNQAVKLVERAMNSRTAPRAFRDEAPEGKANKFRSSVYLAATAVKCLHQHGYLELHAYIDRQYLYSVSVVLVLDAKAYTDLNVDWCALKGLVPFLNVITGSTTAPTRPTLSPCVGLHRQDSFVIAWLASTDFMCKALRQTGGEEKQPAARHRDLRLDDAGTDVAHLQFLLNQVGFNLAVDGDFGPLTASALRAFQQCYPVNGAILGVADQDTKNALQDAARPTAPEGSPHWSKERCHGG